MPANNVGGILYLQALTPLHPGSGTALGAVDLPVQRERHTDWPVIPGSSVKGVLREATENGLRQRLFGAGDAEGTSAGALSFTDARILAFPVRSLKGVFAWVTCPQALQRWSRDAGLVGKVVTLPKMSIDESTAHCAQGSPCVHNGKLILEEFVFDGKPFGLDFFDALEAEERKRLVIMDDTNFSHFAKYGTEVTARIRLEEQSKTAAAGALFYQEFVPAEALFYSLVLAAPSRRPGESVSPQENLAAFQPPGTIQIGGDETTGKGLCSLRLVKGAF
ncbi:MAG TPA: type III-B CRISPR module RAMP protein Cmr4 [Bryobacterales bacterium]|jgi:CRISPR-associated protein Cmr4|nr:type III-B CRISPR module RAMP protein Cmr4 [Bryobacterales bacterium]